MLPSHRSLSHPSRPPSPPPGSPPGSGPVSRANSQRSLVDGAAPPLGARHAVPVDAGPARLHAGAYRALNPVERPLEFEEADADDEDLGPAGRGEGQPGPPQAEDGGGVRTRSPSHQAPEGFEGRLADVRLRASDINADRRLPAALREADAGRLGRDLGYEHARGPADPSPEAVRNGKLIKETALDAINQSGIGLFERIKQRRAFARGFQSGVDTARAVHVQVLAQDRRVRLAQVTAPAQWHDTHRLALASSRPLEDPAAFRMDWPLRHSRLVGAGEFAGKVRFALEHLQKCRPPAAPGHAIADYQDMRPLMHAGVELALRNGGDRIRAPQARALVDELQRQASDPSLAHALKPDELRMVMAGLVAVWDPVVSCEVAQHLFAQGGDSPSPALQALAEGLGIGQGWKGMDLIHHSYAQLPADQQTGGAQALLRRMDQGQAVGKGWLLRLEQALPGMQGHDPGDGYQHLRAVVLLRKHFTPHQTPTLEQAASRPLPGPHAPPGPHARSASIAASSGSAGTEDEDLDDLSDEDADTANGLGDTDALGETEGVRWRGTLARPEDQPEDTGPTEAPRRATTTSQEGREGQEGQEGREVREGRSDSR